MRRCEDCAHIKEWIEYGNVLGDCHNEKAWEFIGSLDGVEDPAAAGCPHYEQSQDEQITG